MSASAEISTTKSSHQTPSGRTSRRSSAPQRASNAASRGTEFPTCPVCADSMVAAESSAFLADNVVSYLWTCDTCGYGFVTNHAVKSISCTS